MDLTASNKQVIEADGAETPDVPAGTWSVAVDPTSDMLTGRIYHEAFSARWAIGTDTVDNTGDLVYCDVHAIEPMVVFAFDFAGQPPADALFRKLCAEAVAAVDLYLAKITDMQIDFAEHTE